MGQHHRFPRGGWRGFRYRPAHAWLADPGDGPTIRARSSPYRKRRFDWRRFAVMLLALLVCIVAWAQLPG